MTKASDSRVLRAFIVGFIMGMFFMKQAAELRLLTIAAPDSKARGFLGPENDSTLPDSLDDSEAPSLFSSSASPSVSASEILSLPPSAAPFASSLPNITSNQNLTHRYPKVVLVTKIHGPEYLDLLRQSLCLLHAAYNRRYLYDILVFCTIPLKKADVNELKKIAYPASLVVKADEKTLQDHVADMTPSQRQALVDRCLDVNTTDDLVWATRCMDGKFKMSIAYCWMSEFRTKWIWHDEALKPYRYMIWFDTDAFAMSSWKRDPMEYVIENNLVLFMANFGQSKTPYVYGIQRLIHSAYGKCLEEMTLDESGFLNTTRRQRQRKCRGGVSQVHGFLHITDMDFYRLPENQKWFEVLIGEGRFQRKWDDQIGVIVPPAMLAPERAAEMMPLGFNPVMMHNNMINGKVKGLPFLKYWKEHAETNFPEAWKVCKKHIKVRAR